MEVLPLTTDTFKSEEPKQRVARFFHLAQNDGGFDEFKDAQENSGTLGGGGACNGVPDPADCEAKKRFCVSTESIQKQCPVACDTCNTGVNAPKSVRLRGYLAVYAASCNTNGVVLHVKRTTQYTLRISRWMRNILIITNISSHSSFFLLLLTRAHISKRTRRRLRQSLQPRQEWARVTTRGTKTIRLKMILQNQTFWVLALQFIYFLFLILYFILFMIAQRFGLRSIEVLQDSKHQLWVYFLYKAVTVRLHIVFFF